MAYREWIIENWRENVAYQRLLRKESDTLSRITELKNAIEMVERGVTPDHYWFQDRQARLGIIDMIGFNEKVVASLTGTTVEKMRAQRWEKDAIEAEQRHKDKMVAFLEHFRDGKDYEIFKGTDLFLGSLPYFEKELGAVISAIGAFRPAPPYDWRNREQEDWYERSVITLEEMLSCLGVHMEYDFNEDWANFIQELSRWNYCFTFTYWLQTDGFTTCMVRNEFVRGKKITKRDFDVWYASLRALLDFIDTHWEVLLEKIHG